MALSSANRQRKSSPSLSCIFEWQVRELGIRPIPARTAGKTNGEWLIAQEHISVPLDCEQGRSAFDSKQ